MATRGARQPCEAQKFYKSRETQSIWQVFETSRGLVSSVVVRSIDRYLRKAVLLYK